MESIAAPVDVLRYRHGAHQMNNVHDHASRTELVRRIALLRAKAAPAMKGAGPFFVPDDLMLSDEAQAIGIFSEAQLFGGVAPFHFIGTKIISHGLVQADGPAPPGWAHGLAAAMGDAVLHGFSVFCAADAQTAGRLLLAHGPVRLKDVEGVSGRGQIVIETPDALDEAVLTFDPARLAASGLVVEENLAQVITYSVGTVQMFGQSIAYWGTQRLTLDNHGDQVYGGSHLHCVRGGFADLLALDLAPELSEVIEKAVRYDHAAFAAYPGLMASRRNYDVAVGCDGHGRQRIGVLEQSWRPGGASGAEIAAFEAFAADPNRSTADMATVEIYGEVDVAPPAAALYFSGIDPVAGPMTKYAMEI